MREGAADGRPFAHPASPSIRSIPAPGPDNGRVFAETLKCRLARADHPSMETAAFAGVFGTIFGSFLNVVVYRLPRRESLVRPASRCPACGTTVKPYDNVPLLSWLLLRGRCRNCSGAISKRYPFVEALTGLLCVGAVVAGGSTASVALHVAFILLLVPIALIDVEHRIIPNKLTALGAILALALGTALDPNGEPARLIAGVGAGGALLLAALARPGAMGMGDVKLAGVMGLFLGSAVAPAMLLALLAGVLYGALLATRTGARQAGKTAVPFGPFLAFGSFVAVFAGAPIVDWYTTSFMS
jgi:leader peptidase (prepilin peptidase) / N-methyltransferase